VEPSRYCWPKPDSIPERVPGRGAAASIIALKSLDFAECDRERLARDAACDGRFYTGVHTTGIYCRPVCPVRPGRSANVSFFPSAAAAETAGFRPCPALPARNRSLFQRLDRQPDDRRAGAAAHRQGGSTRSGGSHCGAPGPAPRHGAPFLTPVWSFRSPSWASPPT